KVIRSAKSRNPRGGLRRQIELRAGIVGMHGQRMNLNLCVRKKWQRRQRLVQLSGVIRAPDSPVSPFAWNPPQTDQRAGGREFARSLAFALPQRLLVFCTACDWADLHLNQKF